MTETYSGTQLQKAVALYYDGKNAPHVSAKGTGAVAEQIINIANEHGVPLCDNAAVVDLLVTLELGDEIPEALYIAVAYIIAFAYQLEGKVPDAWQN
ncbi:EscU/YscU/HrcU family type III secretion system export apparatus switch protein [Cellvibrio sp. QJXJ]|uniref:EscU/YscU/HrcU family type III secretion system export apparatus switch protein n=1 Tax=Cellvibrio sp. QJXJ TaxID=2964606 RepID=UPI0021C29C81|nr:EscU/YscU/HrcU family type III secretion system export apparatus switch protein [Cellvibrio sp. QJXJ]UUA73502.1 EscU/YscU/HrcU family type III secretion system export apparatus switch protein [Cellvibrio sp. QJXJ]